MRKIRLFFYAFLFLFYSCTKSSTTTSSTLTIIEKQFVGTWYPSKEVDSSFVASSTTITVDTIFSTNPYVVFKDSALANSTYHVMIDGSLLGTSYTHINGGIVTSGYWKIDTITGNLLINTVAFKIITINSTNFWLRQELVSGGVKASYNYYFHK